MTDVFCIENIYLLGSYIIPMITIVYMLYDRLIIKGWQFLAGELILIACFFVISLYVQNRVINLVFALFYYSYILMVRENRLNCITAAFISLSAYNMIGNFFAFIFTFVLSVAGENGQWVDLKDVSTGSIVIMLAIMIVSMVLASIYGKYVSDYVYGLKGKKRIILFLLVPVMFLLDMFIKLLLTKDYMYSPGGIMMAIELLLVLEMSISILYVLSRKILQTKRENALIEKQMLDIHREYNEMAKTENELRTLKHEMNNRVILGEDEWE